MSIPKKDALAELETLAMSAMTESFRRSAVDRLKLAAGNFITLICEDEDPSEVQASAIALTSLAAFLVGFAAARTGNSLEKTVVECQEDFLQYARQSYQGHVTNN